MGATLTGAKLFGVKGYVAVKPISIPLMNGEVLPVIHMEKRVSGTPLDSDTRRFRRV